MYHFHQCRCVSLMDFFPPGSAKAHGQFGSGTFPGSCSKNRDGTRSTGLSSCTVQVCRCTMPQSCSEFGHDLTSMIKFCFLSIDLALSKKEGSPLCLFLKGSVLWSSDDPNKKPAYATLLQVCLYFWLYSTLCNHCKHGILCRQPKQILSIPTYFSC